jgi:hypothetical protein
MRVGKPREGFAPRILEAARKHNFHDSYLRELEDTLK